MAFSIAPKKIKNAHVKNGGITGAIIPPKTPVDQFPLMSFVAKNCVFTDEEDSDFRSESALRIENNRRVDGMLRQASQSYQPESEVLSSDERKKALEVLHSLEFTRNQEDTWKISKPDSGTKPDGGRFLHPLRQNDKEDEYFSGTRKPKTPRERKPSRSNDRAIRQDGKLVTTTGVVSQLPIKLSPPTKPPRPRVPSVGLPFTPAQSPPAESVWHIKSGTQLFHHVHSNTLVAYNISCDEETNLARAIAASLHTAKEEEQRILNFREMYKRQCDALSVVSNIEEKDFERPPPDPPGTLWDDDNEVKLFSQTQSIPSKGSQAAGAIKKSVETETGMRAFSYDSVKWNEVEKGTSSLNKEPMYQRPRYGIEKEETGIGTSSCIDYLSTCKALEHKNEDKRVFVTENSGKNGMKEKIQDGKTTCGNVDANKPSETKISDDQPPVNESPQMVPILSEYRTGNASDSSESLSDGEGNIQTRGEIARCNRSTPNTDNFIKRQIAEDSTKSLGLGGTLPVLQNSQSGNGVISISYAEQNLDEGKLDTRLFEGNVSSRVPDVHDIPIGLSGSSELVSHSSVYKQPHVSVSSSQKLSDAHTHHPPKLFSQASFPEALDPQAVASVAGMSSGLCYGMPNNNTIFSSFPGKASDLPNMPQNTLPGFPNHQALGDLSEKTPDFMNRLDNPNIRSALSGSMPVINNFIPGLLPGMENQFLGAFSGLQNILPGTNSFLNGHPGLPNMMPGGLPGVPLNLYTGLPGFKSGLPGVPPGAQPCPDIYSFVSSVNTQVGAMGSANPFSSIHGAPVGSSFSNLSSSLDAATSKTTFNSVPGSSPEPGNIPLLSGKGRGRLGRVLHS